MSKVCFVCGEEIKGAFAEYLTVIYGGEKKYADRKCAVDFLARLLKGKNCDTCSYFVESRGLFDRPSCKKFGRYLFPAIFRFKAIVTEPSVYRRIRRSDYYLCAEKCPQYVNARAEEELKRKQEQQIEHEKKLEWLRTLETAGRFEEAANFYDELEMWEKAGEMRRLAKTSYLISTNFSMGKDGAISLNCPTCGSSQTVESKSNLVICQHCGKKYIIPKKIIDMM